MEETEGGRSVPGQNKFQPNRRTFLKLAGFGAIEAGLALAGCKVVNVKTTPSPTDPDIPALLKATATAIADKGEQTSFVEQQGFSKELFEETRQATYIMEAINQEEGNKEYPPVGKGTSWLIHAEGNDYYFATNKHNVEGFRVGHMKFWRPFIDTDAFEPKQIAFALHPSLDLAVVKCSGDYNPDVPPQTLAWKDDVLLKKGEQVLVVGYPAEFGRNDVNFQQSLTMGTILTADQVSDTGGWWTAKGLSNHGSSGSPAVINNEGNPLAVGILYGGNIVTNENNGQKEAIINGHKLSVTPLINLLKSQIN